MKIMVTGGAGFIASHVVDALIEDGHDVVVVDDLSRGRLEYINPKARFFQMDLTSPFLEQVFSEVKPELVNHHAARTSVNQSMTDPINDARVNILGSLNILQNCVKYGVKHIIYASTGGALYGEPKYLPCDEDHPINPLSPYGASKHAVEHYLYLFRTNWNLDYTILRYPNVYGPRQDPYGEAGVIAIFANRMCRNEEVTINGSGLQERDFLFIKDIVRANIIVTARKGEGKVYNLGSGGSVSINTLFQTLKELSGYKIEPKYRPALKGEVFKIYLDTRRINEDLGWVPSIGFNEGLKATFEYYKQHL
jgi:UDP-glucose 4-epimerase